MAKSVKLPNVELIAYEFSLKRERDEYARVVSGEKRAQREIAARALREGLSVELAAKLSGVSPEEVTAVAAKEGIPIAGR